MVLTLFKVFLYGLFILTVKFTQNQQNKQQHFYSTGKIAHRLFKSIVGWNTHRHILKIEKFFLDCVHNGKESVQCK